MSGAMSASAFIAAGSFFETDEPAVFDPADLLCDIVEFIRMTDDQECFLIFLCIDIMNEIFYCLLIEIRERFVEDDGLLGKGEHTKQIDLLLFSET